MYHLLTSHEQDTLIQERVKALEADHFRERLLFTEAATDDERAVHERNAHELERRISLHVVPPPAEPDVDDIRPDEQASGGADEPVNGHTVLDAEPVTVGDDSDT